MSVERQANLLGQQRLDVPHIRAIESSIAGDFDLLAGRIMAGNNPLIVGGFKLISVAPGTPAISLQIQVAGSVILHPEASENGTIFAVPASRGPETLNAANPRVQGGFTASAVNYIGIDLRRSADSSTADLVQFINADTDAESPKEVPLARTLDYVIIISAQDFSTTPGIAPLAIVTTDAFNNIASATFHAITYPAIQDARNYAFRLGQGGTIPNDKYAYTWPGGRNEIGNNSDFGSGDRVISSLKEWMDAVMTRIWELGGGEHWYAATADRNVKMTRTGTTFTNGEYFEWDGTNLHWRGLTFLFDNSNGYKNEVKDQLTDLPGLTNLADGECIYIDLDRTQNLTGGSALQPVKAQLLTLSYSTVPGTRFVVAWRVGTYVFSRDSGFPVGATFVPATPTSLGLVELTYAAGTPATPKVAPRDANDQISNTASLTGHGFVGVGGLSGGTGWLGVSGDGSFIDARSGVVGIGGANGNGLRGRGTGSGSGVRATGGATSGAIGAEGIGGATDGIGVKGTGTGNGAAVWIDGFAELTTIAPASVPATPASGKARVYLTDNGYTAGSGKRMQIVCKFQDGTAVVLGESEPI